MGGASRRRSGGGGGGAGKDNTGGAPGGGGKAERGTAAAGGVAVRRSRRRQLLYGAGLLAALAAVALPALERLVREATRDSDKLAAFPAPPLQADARPFGGEHSNALLWGTYRPQVYFGVRARLPRSPLLGLMWLNPSTGSVRHACEQGDGLSYGWERHDGRRFGRQEIEDEEAGLEITTWFAKGASGRDWSARIEAHPLVDPSEADKAQPAYLIVYVADEGVGPDTALDISSDGQRVMGDTPGIGPWVARISHMSDGERHVSGAGLQTPHMHNLTEVARGMIHNQVRQTGRVGLGDHAQHESNVAMYMVMGAAPIAVDVVFTTVEKDGVAAADSRALAIASDNLSKLLGDAEDAFDERFDEVFEPKWGNEEDERTIEVAKRALSNMVGGMGYFYGSSVVSVPGEGDRVREHGPAALFTAVPSRPFFPRGFLWDEGFHQLLVGRWDAAISRDALAHWLSRMSADGWIPREQILGAEARSRVPDEFVTQSTANANPPTLLLPLMEATKRAEAAAAAGIADDVNADRLFLVAAYPRLAQWYHWFNETQRGAAPGSFRWRGRSMAAARAGELNPKTLTSGLDDYPRASHPSDKERHVDLYCWMALAASLMAHIAPAAGAPQEAAAAYEADAARLADFDSLNALHYDAATKTYADWGNHTEGVMLKWVSVEPPPGSGLPPQQAQRKLLRRTRRDAPPALGYVPQYGYVSLFPLLMGLLPPSSTQLGDALEQLRDPKRIWSEHGLRSLSRESSLYMAHNTEHDGPYWRGPVWINLNYMALAALKRYAAQEGPYAERAAAIHDELRTNVLRTVVDEYERTGFLWEQYDGDSGEGKGSHPFTGWTALFALLA